MNLIKSSRNQPPPFGLEDRDPYKILGVEPWANKKEIKAAFKRLAGKFHPDKAGGDQNYFLLIGMAKDFLLGDKARERFDRFGIFSVSKNEMEVATERAIGEVRVAIKTFVSKLPNIKTQDIARKIFEAIQTRQGTLLEEIKAIEGEIEKLKEGLSRFKPREGKPGAREILEQLTRELKVEIDSNISKIEAVKKTLLVLDISLDLVDSIVYEVDQVPSEIYSAHSFAWRM